jgi:PAS domain S-box-containing protein
VVEQSPVAVVITDPDGTIEYVNAQFTVSSGYEAAEAIGRNSRILASGETPREVYRGMWAAIAEGRRWAGELLNRRKDGSLHWEMVVIAPVMGDGGRAAHYVAIKEDVTERRSLEDKLRQTNAELEQFAYVASHDLRQPLRMVTSYLGLIEHRLGPDLAGDVREFLGFAVDGAKRMDRLILDLLEYSRTGMAGERGPIPLAEAVADALVNLTVAVREADAEVTVAEGLPVVAGDPTELTRLFQNLIGNAVKYRAPGRRPKVEIGWRRQGNLWQVSVKDNGIGIAPENRERAFAIFQRLSPREGCEGTGIGLAVCKKIVENHGGRIWIDSVPGEGSTFTFTLAAA